MHPIYTRRNLLISLLILLAFFSFFIFSSIRNMRKAMQETYFMNNTLQSLRSMEDILDDMQDIESSGSGFVISGDSIHLIPYEAALLELGKDTSQLKYLYNIYPERKQVYQDLLQAIGAKATRSREMVELVKQRGPGFQASLPDTQWMSNIRSIVGQFEAEDRLALDRSNSSRQQAAWTAGRLFIILAVIFLLGVFLLFWRLLRGLKLREQYEARITYLAGLTEKTSDAIISTDNNLAIKSWNHAAEEMYGYTTEEALGQHISNFLNLVIPENQLVTARKELQEKGYYKGEYEAVKKNGEPILIQASVTALHNAKNQPDGYVALHNDITERKKSEQLLRILNEKLSLQVEEKTAIAANVLERISDGFYSLDPDWNITYMNKPAAVMMGCDPNEMIGHNLWKEFPDAVNLDIYHGYLDAFRKQEYKQVEFYYPPFDRWFMVDIYPSPTGLSTFFRDVTDKRIAEEELKRSNERFEMICRTTNDAVWEWDFETKILWANETHQQLYGLTLADPVPLEKEWQERIHPDDRERLILKQAEALASDTNIFITEYRFRTEENGYRNIYDRCYIVRNKSGKATRILGSMMDITDLKNAEVRLKRREVQLAASIENTPNVAVQWYNSRGEVTYWNHASELLYGWLSSEAMGKKLDELILSSEKTSQFQSVLNHVSETGSTVGPSEYPFRRKDGSMGYCMATIFSIPSVEGDPYFVCMDVDITESKRYAEALQQSEEKYRLIIEQAIDAISLYDANGRILDVNTGAVNLLGYSKEELMHMSLSEVLTKEEIAERPVRYDILEEGKSTVRYRKMKRKDGRVIDTEVRSQQLPDGRFLSVIRDLTERISAEKQLAASYEAIRQLTGHIQDIREEERTSMAREIHDELGQQLTVLKMDVSWLKKKLMTADEPVKQKLHDLISMLDQTVKTVRRISSELRPSILDDLGLVAAMEWQLGEFGKRSDIATHFIYPETELVELPETVKTALFRVLQESLTNVARHAAATEVTVMLMTTPEKLTLSIADNGVGFDKNKIADKKTLGILGMHERIAMIGGGYEIKSQPSEGTEVIVELMLTNIKPITV